MDKKRILEIPPEDLNSKDKALFMLDRLVKYYETILNENSRKTSD